MINLKMSIVESALNLFITRHCAICGKELLGFEKHFCLECFAGIPLTYFWEFKNNPAEIIFWGRAKIERVYSLMFFRNNYKRCVYDVKYKGNIPLGLYLGKMLGEKICSAANKNNQPADNYTPANYVIPVPLHWRKKLKRGFNQAEIIARGIARGLASGIAGGIAGGPANTKVCTQIIKRKHFTKTQTQKDRLSRWRNVEDAFGMGIQWLCMLNMLVGVIVAFIFFGLRTQKMGAQMNVSTFPQFLGQHFGSRGVRVFIAVVIFLAMPIYAAVVMKGGAVFLEEIFHVDYNVSLLIFTLVIAAYVIAGGIKGVMYTDALQAVIMFVCMLFLIIFLYTDVLHIGFTEANRQLTSLAPMVPEKFRQLGHEGWTMMPRSGSPQWYTLVTSLIMGVGIGCLAQPQLVVRFMTVKSSNELKRGVFIGSLFIFVTVGVIYHTCVLINIYFYLHQGMVATDFIKDIDKIIPYFINNAMPTWFSALFM